MDEITSFLKHPSIYVNVLISDYVNNVVIFWKHDPALITHLAYSSPVYSLMFV